MILFSGTPALAKVSIRGRSKSRFGTGRVTSQIAIAALRTLRASSVSGALLIGLAKASHTASCGSCKTGIAGFCNWRFGSPRSCSYGALNRHCRFAKDVNIQFLPQFDWQDTSAVVQVAMHDVLMLCLSVPIVFPPSPGMLGIVGEVTSQGNFAVISPHQFLNAFA